ncbi:MAG: response regulator transcription factor [Agarilytica sp.]
MITIALVEDQPIIRHGIKDIIELGSKYRVLIQAENGKDALAKLNDTAVDLIISDIRMPEMDGITLLKHLRNQKARTQFLMLTTFDDTDLFLSAVAAGCNGFLLKDVTKEKLHKAIDIVGNGGTMIEPQTLISLTEKNTLPSDKIDTKTLGHEKLSEKEKQVLRLAAAGFSNKEIASGMHLAEGTIKNHMTRMLEKLNCRDRTQAVVKAMQLRII